MKKPLFMLLLASLICTSCTTTYEVKSYAIPTGHLPVEAHGNVFSYKRAISVAPEHIIYSGETKIRKTLGVALLESMFSLEGGAKGTWDGTISRAVETYNPKISFDAQVESDDYGNPIKVSDFGLFEVSNMFGIYQFSPIDMWKDSWRYSDVAIPKAVATCFIEGRQFTLYATSVEVQNGSYRAGTIEELFSLEEQLFHLFGEDGKLYGEFSRYGYRIFDVKNPIVQEERVWVPMAIYAIIQDICLQRENLL